MGLRKAIKDIAYLKILFLYLQHNKYKVLIIKTHYL